MSSHFVQYEIYKNLKYFTDIRGLTVEYPIFYPVKKTENVDCKAIIGSFNINKFTITSYKIKDNTKTYIIIYENNKTSSDIIQKMIDLIPESKYLKRTHNIDVHIIIPQEYVKTNIVRKINNLKISTNPYLDITWHGYDIFLLGNLKESYLYVDNVKLDEKEKEEILNFTKYKKLTIITNDSPIAKYMGYKKNDIIKIEYSNIEMGVEVEYKQII